MAHRPNVLFLLSDEHSFRCLSALAPDEGGEPVRTPTLDALIERGAWLRRAYCQMPLCTPSRMCLLSGREVEDCGAWANGSILRPDIPTLGSHFTAAGYATCTVGKLHFGGRGQYAGFQHRPYGDFGGPCSHQPDPLARDDTLNGMRARTELAGVSEVPESLLQEQMAAREAQAWLRETIARQPDTPWLLNVSFSRPHFPLTAPRRHFERYWPEGVTPPRVGPGGDAHDHPMSAGMRAGFQVDAIAEDEAMRARAAYFACVDTLDEIIGDLLALLERDGFLDNTIVVYTSDHGELAGEHGLWWKNSWHEAAARVPLVVQLPEHRRGELAPRAVDTAVSLADLFPTLCGLTGTAPPEGLAGTDLSPALRGGEMPARRSPVLCQCLWPRWGEGTEFRMVVDDRLKYVHFRGAPDLMFDLAADPDEQRDVAGSHPDAGRLAALAGQGFSFDDAEAQRRRDKEELSEAYGLKVKPVTPNQIRLSDGRLVEADAPLYRPIVVSEAPDEDFGRQGE